MEKKKVIIHRESRVFNGYFKIDEVELSHELSDGSMSEKITRLCFERGDAVAALVFHTEKKKFLFTSQFRYPAYRKGKGWLVEIVAGGIAPNEAPEKALFREVEEELGYRINDAKFLHTFFVSPGGTSERIFLYYAEISESEKVNDGGGLESEHEDIELVWLSAKELEQKVAEGKITDAKTMVAYYWAKERHPAFRRA